MALRWLHVQFALVGANVQPRAARLHAAAQQQNQLQFPVQMGRPILHRIDQQLQIPDLRIIHDFNFVTQRTRPLV